MSRYFYYLALANMLMNVIAFVPKVISRDQYNGAVMAILVTALIGTVLTYMFMHAVSKFPQQGLPEILDTFAPGWVKSGLLIFFSLFWYTAGAISILAFADYTRKFINPDMSMTTITCLYLAVVVLTCRFRTKKILYLLEIMLLVSVPLTSFILFKSFFNKDISWDDIAAVSVYYTKWPQWPDLAALSYIYTGYVNLVIFNRELKPFQVKWLWPVPVIGFIISCTTVFIPIGFLGADAVKEYVFPWMSTADSMRIELGFIERVLFIFIFMYGYIAFASMFVHWHVALELMKSALPLKRMSDRVQSWKPFGVIALFCIFILAIVQSIDDRRLFYWGELWLDVRLPAEFLLVAIVVYAARRLKTKS